MIVVIGGGLAGLSTSIHLSRLAPDLPCLVLEGQSEAGGLCRSRRVGGFTFDFTGHYLHMRDPAMISWVDEMLGEKMTQVDRRARIHTRGQRLNFPFQANLHSLPSDVVTRCVVDFFAAGETRSKPASAPNFAQWARQTFGDGIAEEFMLPYNAKLFGVEPEDLSSEWVSWSVPRPSGEDVVRGALGLGNEGMGYNSRFRYPVSGGIGVLADALADRAGDALRCGAQVDRIDAGAHTVHLASGEVIPYDTLVSTMPLPALLRAVEGLDRGGEPLASAADRLRASAVLELALGVERESIAEGAHWVYFPEAKYPFYRVGFPSNVCAAMAPAGCSSLSVEFSWPSGVPSPSLESLVEEARAGLEEAGVLGHRDKILVRDLARLDPAYVLYDHQRTALVDGVLGRLAEAKIHSIGRFGAWCYSYMERALLDGAEIAASIAKTAGGSGA